MFTSKLQGRSAIPLFLLQPTPASMPGRWDPLSFHPCCQVREAVKPCHRQHLNQDSRPRKLWNTVWIYHDLPIAAWWLSHHNDYMKQYKQYKQYKPRTRDWPPTHCWLKLPETWVKLMPSFTTWFCLWNRCIWVCMKIGNPYSHRCNILFALYKWQFYG